MRGPRTVAVAAAALILAGLSACAGSDDPKPAASAPDVIRLASLLPLTGRSSHSGEAMLNGAKLAVSEVNAAGGVLGRQVELVAEDDACDPGTAVTAAQTVVKKDVTLSVGGYCSSAVVPTLKIFRDAGIPMIIAQANSTDLIEPRYDSVFLICGTVTAEAEFAVEWMNRLGGKRLAVVHDGTSFPVTLAEETAEHARKTGSPAVAGELKLSQGATDYKRTAGAIIGAKADVVYYTGYYGEANQLIKDLRAEGFTGRIVVGDGATDGPLLADLSESQARDVYGTALLVPAFMPELKDWSQRYKAAYGADPGPSSPEAYDAVMVAVDAIKRAGSTDREAVRVALSGTDLAALSGEVAFNADGTRTVPKFLLLEANGKDFRLRTE
ncbi:branched chain amino acid ABC transporter substrate-binding protein [Actinoplanes italicus]|uniref:Amino acid/amide ABC transporter substrate-binding protein (HAAT family) n=1 Tax=Actinoplanes italicus TaxID=113567 RepID=A0A2T0K4C4_9ACTN|nr:branched-chain amino acid ABC transporter substrate-binding protein [Actinoplanes italicus]PRX17714.1 amino acid/amide ABC transporter substrate-binding protein (HAAT family) [Actinoplanes italicus]GIE35720.1 branched chain amino acid ABC transporter substrate-binding protein [Actinoplanes italicus]